MRSFAWLRARPRTLASAAVVTVAAVTVGVLAAVYDGNPTTEVDLHDGGVWVTKESSLLVGHLNHESGVLDGGLRTTASEFDLHQSGAHVLVVDPAASTVTAVDPARVVMDATADLAPGAAVALGGDTVAVLDSGGGALRAVEFAGLGGFAPETVDPLAELGAGAVVTVGVDGTIHAVAPEQGTITSYARGADGAFTRTASRDVDGIEPGNELSLTAVGDTPYVLDATTGTLYGGDGSRGDAPPGAVLQQPSTAAESLTLATPTSLVRVPLGGGDIVAMDSGGAEGVPAAPVFVAGCAYAAWSGSGQFVRDCPGEADDVADAIAGIEPTSILRFRVNRDVVVLNDVFGGAAWLASASMQRVDNWEDITPPEGTGDEEEETTEETLETTLPERTEQNTPPTAVDDDFGARPGRTTILPILDNDSDPDGDVLVASVDDEPSMGVVEPIHNGAALQITLPEDAEGTTSFGYTIEDGRGGEASARVTVSVHGWDVNSPPVQKRVTPIAVESGGVASYNVLSDWIDPDGDDVYLREVAPTDGDEADFTSDGQITYRALGGVQGRKDMPIVVSDGTLDGAGVARYDIRPLGSTVPITNADHVVTRVGRTVTVAPLANDTSAGREQLRLARVDETAGAVIEPDYADKTFTFTSEQTGTYYVQYLASAGPNSVPGLVRVDVLPAADTDLPPVAVRDVALLPSGRDVLVNVLGNDTDPAGGILVVQSVTVEPGTGVSAAVLGHETVRITDTGALTEQIRVGYTISNGLQSATGEIVVIPVDAPSRLRPPVANDDQVLVRAGDVVTIPVLDNDYHPNGSPIHVAPDLVEPLIAPADGHAFVSEDTVRFRAGDEAKTVYATYETVDDTGQRDAGYITIQILPRDDEANAAPRPRDLTVRALSGAKVKVAIPLHGIDEDGDSVELVGVADPPAKGRITETDVDSFVYEAFEAGVGVDSFTYRVRDRLGKEGTATVHVGIAPAATVNQAPYAVRDAVVMRPSRQVAVPVLANDSDPDGEVPFFAPNALEVPDVAGLAAEVSGEHVLITSPDREMQTSIQYTIQDERGLTSTAAVQITVDEDVPLLRPIARDDRVRAETIDDGVAEIDVLANDDDPDGTKSALTVELGAGSESATLVREGIVRVTITDEAQLITYTIRDQDDQTATAFVRVPALSDLPPTLYNTETLTVASGETVEIALADYVRASDGGGVVITEEAKATAAHSNGASLVKDETTLVYTSADRYFGADAITFEVTDGTGPDDPEGVKAVLTIPVLVLPPENQPPTMTGAQVSVAQGEDAVTLDLAPLASDPDPEDELSFALVGGAPSGMSASLDGSVLSVSAATDTPKGTTGAVTVSVSDGEADPVEATITVSVIASTRPLASANDDVVDEADQGARITIPVLDNDVNPFPETPLEIVEVTTETGDARAFIEGSSVAVESGATFVGTVVVRYRVQDATGDPDRAVDGRIRVTVQGRPDAPGTPTVSSVQSKTVVLSWTPPIDNGTPITGYTVTSTSGDIVRECASTTCTIGGLTNNVEYNFTVTATNRVGVSDPSPPSETARPDVRPETPAAPTLGFRDRGLDVSWTAPRTDGSPIQSYTLEISPAPPSGVTQKTVGNVTSAVWDGLENGTAYQVRVRAHNLAPEPSAFSPYSQSMIPARAPDAAGAPSSARLEPVGNRAQLQASWAAPAYNGGDAISGWELNVLQGSTVVRTIQNIPAGATTQAIEVATSTSDYSFSVRSRNKAGWSAWSAASAPRRGFTPPGTPTMGAATEGDNSVTVTWTPGALNGANASEVRYQYAVGTGGWRSDWVSGGSGGSGTIGNGQVNNNGSYTVRVRAVVTIDGTTYESGASGPSNSVAPYGPIGNPSANASANGRNITVSWSSPPRNGRDITTQIRVNGGAWETVAASGSRPYNGVPYSTTYTIQTRTTAAGQTTTSAVASARTVDPPPPPQPRVWVTQGIFVNAGCVNGCYRFRVNYENLNIGNATVTCHTERGKIGSQYTVNFNGTGYSDAPTCYLGADGYNVWIDIQGWGSSVDTETSWWPRR